MNRRPSWISRKPIGTRPPSSPVIPPVVPPGEAASADAPVPPPPAPQVVEPPAYVPDPGMVAELEQFREDNAALQGRIAEMAITMARLRREILEASEPEVIQLALSIAERVVRNELATNPSLIVTWVREALQSLSAKGEVVIAIAPDVASQVPTDAWEALGIEHRVQTDVEMPVGAVEVRTPEAVVAAGAQARLQSVAEALGVGES